MLDEKLRERLESIPASNFTSPTSLRTESLFRDPVSKSYNPKYAVYYLNRDKSDDDFISLKEVYLQLSDPTEYEFAMLCFKSVRHFKHMETLSWFSVRLNEWRDELSAKLRSTAVRSIERLAKDSSVAPAARFSALKWLADSGYASRSSSKGAGRPKKVVSEPDESAAVSTDIARLGILRGVK